MSNAKLALLNDRVYEISDDYSIVCLDGKYAVYANGALSEYKYTDMWGFTKKIMCLSDENNNISMFGADGKVRVQFDSGINGLMDSIVLAEIQSKFSIGELLDGCYTESEGKRKSYRYKKYMTTHKVESTGVKLTVILDYTEYNALISSDKQSYILQLCDMYKDLTSEMLGYRVVYRSSQTVKPGRYRSYIDDSTGELIDTSGRVVFSNKGAIRRLDKKGKLYQYNGEMGGLLNVNPSTKEIKKVLELPTLDVKYYNDDFILVDSLNHDSEDSRRHLTKVIDIFGNQLFPYLLDIRNEKGTNDLVGTYINNAGLRVKAILTPSKGKILKLNSNCKVMRMAFGILKVINPDNSFYYYDNGNEYKTMSFIYACAKRVEMPLCKEAVFGVMNEKLEWYVTNNYGEPIDIEPYNSFEEIQAEFRNKFQLPMDRKTFNRVIL